MLKNNNEDIICINPVKEYAAPKLPTIEDTRDNPGLLKKLPSRWNKNATVLACIGFLGAITLTGCSLHLGGAGAGGEPFYVPRPTEQDISSYRMHHGGTAIDPFYIDEIPVAEVLDDIHAQLERMQTAELELRVHHGGAGSGPFYVVHFTEQEALNLIRLQLEIAGLNFNATPPEYTVDTWATPNIALDLFDEERNIAITNISWRDSNQPFMETGHRFANMISEEFAQQTNDISVGVFYNPGHTIHEFEPTKELKDEARTVLIEGITTQVQEFITWLQAEGIL